MTDDDLGMFVVMWHDHRKRLHVLDFTDGAEARACGYDLEDKGMVNVTVDGPRWPPLDAERELLAKERTWRATVGRYQERYVKARLEAQELLDLVETAEAMVGPLRDTVGA